MTTRAALVLVLLAGAARGQTITDWHQTPAILTLAAPGVHCDVFAQHPAGSQVQIACYLGTALIYNAVATIGNDTGVVCSVVGTIFNLAWSLIPVTSPLIGYQVAAQATSTPIQYLYCCQGPPLFFGVMPTASPGEAVAAGTF
jgi:hypothetical protein